jgi:glycosyltransferase involved in cell wall biosynthesis
MARAAGIVHFPAAVDFNPYTRLLYAALARRGIALHPDAELTLAWLRLHRRHVHALHFHWNTNDLYERRLGPPETWRRQSLVGLAGFVALLGAARLLGYRILWTVHELHSHHALDRRYERIAAYVGFYERGRSREEVRAELGIPAGAFAFLSLGSLKPYKRVDRLLDAFARVGRADVALVVAGSVRDERLGSAVRAAAETDGRIVPLLQLVPEERVGELYGACDAAVFARDDGWTSGSLVLALSQGLPAIVPALPAYLDLIGGDEAGWSYAAGSTDGLRAALEAAAGDPEAARRKGKAARARAERLSWEPYAERVAAALRRR